MPITISVIVNSNGGDCGLITADMSVVMMTTSHCGLELVNENA